MKYKKIILLSLLVVLCLIITIILLKINSNPKSDSDFVYDDVVVENLTLKNAKVDYESGKSVFEVEIINNGSEQTAIDYVAVNLINEDGISITLKCDVNDILNANDSKVVSSEIDADLSNYKKVEYVIVR